MTTEQRKRFTVISNTDFKENTTEHKKSYQTNPMTEKLLKFTEKEKFSVQDLLKW